nr:hypothetical protein [Paeniclostridium ghonii]
MNDFIWSMLYLRAISYERRSTRAGIKEVDEVLDMCAAPGEKNLMEYLKIIIQKALE